ncbi:unnamed protein product [Symbiodinium natans]|uniref:Uncharacterized protein n=1 Tax=Symbiodinium natans TaxID=878477 RepID=A0A812UTW0_9DINO|nr:unnamed protein product [Symbiodinium natans]
MPGQDRGRSRSPAAGLNTRRISSAICGMVRYEKNRPAGLHVDSDGTFDLDNLMEVWGERQGLTKQGIINAVQVHMFQDQISRTLRYSMKEEDNEVVSIRVHPSRNQGGRFSGASVSRHNRKESRGGTWWRDKYRWSGGQGDEGGITDEEDVLGAAKREPGGEWPASATKKEKDAASWSGTWAKAEPEEDWNWASNSWGSGQWRTKHEQEDV